MRGIFEFRQESVPCQVSVNVRKHIKRGETPDWHWIPFARTFQPHQCDENWRHVDFSFTTIAPPFKHGGRYFSLNLGLPPLRLDDITSFWRIE